MESSLDQFTFNSRPAAASFQHSSKEKSRSDREQYKYTVIICNNSNSVCQYCHIKIKQQDIMLMTKSQTASNDSMSTPCYYGYHCDCFFLSSNVCKNTAELYGYNSLSKYHRHYIGRKISKSQPKSQSGATTKEVPGDLKVGYTILDRRLSYYCEQCHMAMLPSDIKIAGILKKFNDLVVYHPRCFSQAFDRYPIKLQGMEKLLPYDISGLKSMLNIIDTTEKAYDRYDKKPSKIDSVMKFKTTKDHFVWPRNNSAPPPTPAPRHEQNRSSSSSSGHNKLLDEWDPRPARVLSDDWNSSNPPRLPHHHHSRHPGYKSSRSKPSQFDELLRDTMSRSSDSSKRTEEYSQRKHVVSNSSNSAGCSRKRRNSFKPNTEHLSSRSANISKSTTDQPACWLPARKEKSHDHHRSSSSETYSDPNKKSHPDTSESSGKVELKKSTIRSEITKILYKYNHDYITSKIVRTMLMQKFGCDLTPHKKYIDDTIMELLDIIDNNPINLKSIPGRVFVEEGEIEDLVTSPVSPTDRAESHSPTRSPMSANIDDISPFAIMGNQADEIALSNVDNTVRENSSKKAWGDKSNSPKEKSKGDQVTEGEKSVEGEKGDYALTKEDKPISLLECCLCCFRIQSLEELASLYNHVQTKHKSEVTCVVCDIKFTDVYTLMLHVAEFHRRKDSFKCKKCRETFNHHSELSKHWDFCYLSSESEDCEEVEEKSPVRTTPRKKKFQKRAQPGMPELVSTLKNTQHTLDKIKTFISSEAGEDL